MTCGGLGAAGLCFNTRPSQPLAQPSTSNHNQPFHFCLSWLANRLVRPCNFKNSTSFKIRTFLGGTQKRLCIFCFKKRALFLQPYVVSYSFRHMIYGPIVIQKHHLMFFKKHWVSVLIQPGCHKEFNISISLLCLFCINVFYFL